MAVVLITKRFQHKIHETLVQIKVQMNEKFRVFCKQMH